MVKIHISKQLGIGITKKFPLSIYEKIHSIMCHQKQKYPQSVSEFLGAWNAVAYRFHACAESNEGFTESFKKAGDAPPQPKRYIQEKELFHFFVNGYSTLESFCYALYIIASTVVPSFFPIKPSNLRSIYIRTTCDKFNSKKDGFHNERITGKLNQLQNSPEFKEWKIIRHTLIHRIAPGRTIRLQSGSIKKRGKTSWNIDNSITIDIDEYTTSSRFLWLEDSLFNIMDATQDFIQNI